MYGLSRNRGFTLVELVVAIALSSIVIAFMAVFIAGPVAAFGDQARRAELVDLAENALRRVARDVRRALPNSLRVTASGGRVALEMLNSVDGVRYREGPPPGDPDKRLAFNQADAAFNSMGHFTQVAKPFSSTTHYLSIYNVGVPGADAYELGNVITPPGTRIDIDDDVTPGEDNIRLSPAFRFAYGSPGQRLFLLDGPVTYLCDPLTGLLRRYDGYAITADQSQRDEHGELLAAGARVTVVSDRVSGCVFNYTAGAAQRAGLVSLSLAIEEAGERITLLHQVHVDNVP